MRHRFFIPSPWIQANRVTIAGPQARQIARAKDDMLKCPVAKCLPNRPN